MRKDEVVNNCDDHTSYDSGYLSPVELAIIRLLSLIQKSPVPEDPLHSSNTLEWLLKLAPNSGQALRIAAVGHDIERAMGVRRIRKEDFPDFEAFKAAHAMNSAVIIKEILQACGVDASLTEKVFRLVRLHETGGDEQSDLLKTADSLSFFEVNLPLYAARHGAEEVFRRCVWGYKRLTPETRRIVQQFEYADERLNALIREIAVIFES